MVYDVAMPNINKKYPVHKMDELELDLIKELVRLHGGVNIDGFGTIKINKGHSPNFNKETRKISFRDGEKVADSHTKKVSMNLFRSFTNSVKEK